MPLSLKGAAGAYMLRNSKGEGGRLRGGVRDD